MVNKNKKQNNQQRTQSPDAPSLLNLTIPGYIVGSEKRKKEIEAPKKPRSIKKIIKRTMLLILVLIVGSGAFFGIKDIGDIDKVFHGNLLSDLEALIHPVKLKGESVGRVNILLAGDSSDDPGHQGAQLTDSILLLSINTRSDTAFLLSIPRDLWVQLPSGNYPGGTYEKINAANEITSFRQSGYPSGGMGALSYVVQNDLGIPIDYYGLMDYGAFKDSVDAVGGITIDIQSPDPRGLYDPNTHIDLPNGPVTLDGQEALNLARARGDGYGSYGFPDSDFDRTEHQRQMFVAVAKKAKTLGVVSNPVKISDLFNALGNNFQTNLSLADVLRLVKITKPINVSAIQSFAYSSTVSSTTPNPVLRSFISSSGQDALIPTAGIGNFSQVQAYYQQLTAQ